MLHGLQIIVCVATGWLVAPGNINNAQSSLNRAHECGLHGQIFGEGVGGEILKFWQTPLEDDDLN